MSAREPTPATRRPAATIMTKLRHDLRHHQPFSGFFQISFLQSEKLLGESLAQTNALGLINFFAHRADEAFISTIRQILDSFVRILNTSVIGHQFQKRCQDFVSSHDTTLP